jgi:hypothetical protein
LGLGDLVLFVWRISGGGGVGVGVGTKCVGRAGGGWGLWGLISSSCLMMGWETAMVFIRLGCGGQLTGGASAARDISADFWWEIEARRLLAGIKE